MYTYTSKVTRNLGHFFLSYYRFQIGVRRPLSTWLPILSIQSKNEIGGSADLTSEQSLKLVSIRIA